ncbi:WXG100 family type VII secretion target, partial [Streptomyces sp. NPDC059564]|uniref:WXG100 family type VII secretion target n=1 Tax=Streptomyces sp. NPDC059564 TaxID=3346865 RepID=UPI0036ACCCA5
MTDWGKLADTGLAKLEDTWDAAKKKVGEEVDKASDELGGYLDRVGAHRLADQVEDVGDGIASDLGASVREQRLGETEQTNELVHGSPAAIRATAAHMKDFHTAFDRVGQGMKALDSGHWKGAAADAFREKFAVQPTGWLQAADACRAAGGALERYAETVEWAQQQAGQAIVLHKQAVKAHKDAADTYTRQADAYRTTALAGKNPGPVPVQPVDVGAAEARRAQEILDEARRQRGDAAAAAGRALRAALEHAPAAPSARAQAMAMATDQAASQALELNHVIGGAVKGTAGMINFARGLSPFDSYSVTHPAEYLQNLHMTLAGLVSTPAHPERVVSALVDPFRDDAYEGVGRLLPELIGAKGGGGAAPGGGGGPPQAGGSGGGQGPAAPGAGGFKKKQPPQH